MKEQLLSAWRIHNRMNLLLLENTPETGMQKTLSTRGGRNVRAQLLHMLNVRLQWLEISAKDIFGKYKALADRLKKPGSHTPVATDKKTLSTAFEESGIAMEELFSRSWDDNGKVKSFKPGLIPMLGYLISHESHHRGNILLTLKQSGEKIPDTVKWGLWEWGK